MIPSLHFPFEKALSVQDILGNVATSHYGHLTIRFLLVIVPSRPVEEAL